MEIVMKGEIITMKKKLALLLALVMVCISVLSGCGGGGSADKPMVVGYSNFSSKFSPFFSETAYDQDVWTLTQVVLLGLDRLGAVVEKGKTGEDREYNGTSYHYDGPADLTITENKDGTVDYDFDLRDDIKFSDGEPLTADDVIFSMYVLSDPTYDGSSTLYSIPIKGMNEYRAGMASLMSLLYEAGKDNKLPKATTRKATPYLHAPQTGALRSLKTLQPQISSGLWLNHTVETSTLFHRQRAQVLHSQTSASILLTMLSVSRPAIPQTASPESRRPATTALRSL